jgi:hypothetical protein
LYPRVNDDTLEIKENWKDDKIFILQEGSNCITYNYIRRTLTSNDNITEPSKNEVGGNIKTYFEVSCGQGSDAYKLINRSESPIYIKMRANQSHQVVEAQGSCDLIDGSVLYFELPTKGKVSFKEVLDSSSSAVSCRIARLILNR